MESQISLRLPNALLQQLDDWCKAQPLRPNRTQAIRAFVEAGLKPEQARMDTPSDASGEWRNPSFYKSY